MPYWDLVKTSSPRLESWKLAGFAEIVRRNCPKMLSQFPTCNFSNFRHFSYVFFFFLQIWQTEKRLNYRSFTKPCRWSNQSRDNRFETETCNLRDRTRKNRSRGRNQISRFHHWQLIQRNFNIAETRGVTRLDGGLGKKQVWRPHVWIWGFPKQMYCIEENISDIAGAYLCPLQWFGAPIVIQRPGIAPLVTPLAETWKANIYFNISCDRQGWLQVNSVTGVYHISHASFAKQTDLQVANILTECNRSRLASL